jgi:fucose 4-O-acetylase-like acetyltransferase
MNITPFQHGLPSPPFFSGFILTSTADFFLHGGAARLFIPLFCFVFFPLFCVIVIHLLTFAPLLPLLTRCSLQCNTFTFCWWRTIYHVSSIRCCATALRHVCVDERTASSSRNANHSVFFNYAKSPQSYCENEPNPNRPTVGWDALLLPRCGFS